MIRAPFVWWTSVVVFVGVGIACSDDAPSDPGAPLDGGGPVFPDSGVVDARDEPDAPRSRCSPSGWCETDLPDPDLVLRGIAPFEGRAFATAESPTVGVKVLEWEDATASWKYIDDGSQNQTGLARYVGTIWAPSVNELYYAIARGTIMHGTRSSQASPWTWTASVLEDRSPVHSNDDLRHGYTHDYPPEAVTKDPYPTLGVWGTSAGDVYAWYTNTVYHLRERDGGSPSWIAEYTADDAADDHEELFALGATGSGPDDVWFTFVRTNMAAIQGACPVLVRKTPAGYRRISDGVPVDAYCQDVRPGYLKIGPSRGWLNAVESIGNGSVVGILGGRQLVRVTADGDGYRVVDSMILGLPLVDGQDGDRGSEPVFFSSLYAPADRLWMGGMGLPGTGIVVHAGAVWDGGGDYRLSSISITGAPLEGSRFQLRGTSATNLWLVGARHALHKITP